MLTTADAGRFVSPFASLIPWFWSMVSKHTFIHYRPLIFPHTCETHCMMTRRRGGDDDDKSGRSRGVVVEEEELKEEEGRRRREEK